MKIALFTPTHEQSAIGRVTVLVRSALQMAGHDVPLIATELSEIALAETNPKLVDSVRWTDADNVRQIVAESDIVMHQIGDHYAYHAGSVAWLSEIGGVVALHDFFLGDMFLSWVGGHERQAEQVLESWYALSLGDYVNMARGGRFVERTWPSYPLTEWICSQADGVIIHSDFGLDLVLRATSAPVRVLQLPYDLAGRPVIDASNSTGSIGRQIKATNPLFSGNNRLTILTFGRINKNKLCDLIISSIAADSALRAAAEFRIVGTIPPEDSAYLAAMAHALGVRLQILGEVSQQVLITELEGADVIACLRSPALESASASAVEGMLSGTPLIVVDTGFYVGLPRDAVFHLPPLGAQSAMTKLLREIVGNEHDLQAMGRAAARHAEATYRADNYASALVGLGMEVASRRPLLEIDRAYAATLAPWGTNARSSSIAIFEQDTAIFRE